MVSFFVYLSFDGMAFVAIATFLLFRILLAGTAYHWFEDKSLPGGFAEYFKAPIWQKAGIPVWLAIFGDWISPML